MIMQMSEMIQGFKLQHSVNSMDFNRTCTHFATGGKQSIKLISLNLNNQCWFKGQKTYGKYKSTTQTKANVNQLAWNKQGNQLLAIGTNTGLVVVYDTQAPYKNVMQTKGHQGDIKNVQWHPGSPFLFVTSCFDNEILEWDVRKEKSVTKYEFSESIKIRDLKFNHHHPNQIAVQSSRKLQLIDIRKSSQIVTSYEIMSNELHGIGVKWDPVNSHRLASAISKEIVVFDISSGNFQQVDCLTHYALIKNFHWMKTKPSFFGIMCDKPQKNIVFYDLEDKHRLAYYYGGHQRPMDCWIMNQQETILISASTQKQKASKGPTNPFSGLLVAQYTENYFDPNQVKFNHPLTFSNDSQIAFCLNQDNNLSKKSGGSDMRKKTRPIQTNPSVYEFRDTIQWFERQKGSLFPLSLKEQVVYLAKNYIIQGNNEKISQNNSFVAARIGKSYCSQMWKNIFLICYPMEEVPTIESLYERKAKVNSTIVDNRVILHSKEGKMKPAHKIDVTSMLQWLVDEHNELQTAALAAVCLLTHAPDVVSESFLDQVWNPYIELLRSLELFQLAASSILLTGIKKYTQITEVDTKYSLTCGSCKLSISKGECKCNLLCVRCEERLDKKLVIWCKYCGHGGHAVQYEKWFKIEKNKLCPHGCGHQCFSTEN